jgi:hypothetical protein
VHLFAFGDSTSAIRDWGPLLATFILIGITGWYAYLTKELAAAAKDSAQSSKEAAMATKSALAATIATVNVTFRLSPSYGSTNSGPEGDELLFSGVELTCDGATVFVHGMMLYSASWPLGPGDSMQTIFLEPLYTGRELPTRLHRGETAHFQLPERQRRKRSVSGLEATVHYSLAPDSEPIARQVEWQGRPGVDFDYVQEDSTTPDVSGDE